MAKRRIFVPEWNKHVILGGCRLPKHTPHGFKLKDFLVAVPTSAATCDYSAPAITVLQNIEGNGEYGDCVEAEDAHNIAVTTGNSGNGLFAYTPTQTLADYSAITGFNAADPSTDQGTDPTTDLNYRVATGYADGSKDLGWMLVDATNKAEVMYAIANFGTVKMWFGIPDSIANNLGAVTNGTVWDVTAGAPDQSNGHSVGSCGYGVNKITLPAQVIAVTADGLLVYTWGLLIIVTWAAVAAWFAPVNGGGMAVRVTLDWVNKQSGKAPSGLNVTALLTAFNTYFGGNVPIPAPVPAPSPTPAPAPLVTLAQAQAWTSSAKGLGSGSLILTRANAEALANAGLAANWPKS